MLKVEIDPLSGFCGGVIRAINCAEKSLDTEATLYSLGEIVHNEAELSRLAARGLKTASSPEEVPEGAKVLIRAHGEPPATYKMASSRSQEIIDCTCPVVLKIQKSIREAYARLGSKGKVIIFGRVGHAEVLGLLGQVGGDALVVENKEMLSRAIESSLLDLSLPIEIFSQTTKSPSEYAAVCNYLKSKGASVTVHDTICAQVASRHEKLKAFASSHDAVVFVSGKSSSNGKVLSDLCHSVNPRTYNVGGPSEISREWFHGLSSVGVCGATSTPKWLLEEVASAIRE